MLSNKKGCPRKTNVGLDQVSLVPLDWSMEDTQTHAKTCMQACKDVKKQRKLNRWHKASMTSISTSHKAGKGVYQAHQHHRVDHTSNHYRIVTTMLIHIWNEHPDIQANKFKCKVLFACPTLNQCTKHEIGRASCRERV